MLLILFCAFAGLMVGSFINVLVLRTRADTNWVSGRSECPHCKKPLKIKDLIPVVSYVVLGGRCRYCHKPISKQYPIVEATTALIYVLLAIRYHSTLSTNWIHLVFWLLITIPLIAAATYDVRWHELPDKFTLVAIGLAIGGVIWLQLGTHQDILVQRLLNTAFFGGGVYLLWLFSDGQWIGDGDIRLAVLMGLLFTTPMLVLAILISLNLAALISVILLATHKKTRKDHIPLGIFLVTGIYLTLFLGGYILNWYGNLIHVRF